MELGHSTSSCQPRLSSDTGVAPSPPSPLQTPVPRQQGHLMENTTGSKQTVCNAQRPPAGTLPCPGWLRGDSLLRLPTSTLQECLLLFTENNLPRVHNCLLEIPGPGMSQASTRKAIRCGHHIFCHNPELPPLAKSVNGAAEECMDMFTRRGKD